MFAVFMLGRCLILSDNMCLYISTVKPRYSVLRPLFSLKEACPKKQGGLIIKL